MTSATPLIDAVTGGDESAALEILRAHPESVHERGAAGERPVLLAIYYGKTSLASAIAERIEPDLCEAAALGDTTRVNTLLAKGDSTDARSYDGWTPLHLAGFFGNTDVARVLLDHGAAMEAISANSTANTPICAALAGKTNIELVRLLVERGANVNARVEAGITPLHIAASRGAMDLIDLLLDAGASASAKMDDGVTPSGMAAARGHAEAAARLTVN